MYVFLYSPFGNKRDCLGSENIWKVITNGVNTKRGTFYYGPIHYLPIDMLPNYELHFGLPGTTFETKIYLTNFSIESMNALINLKLPIILSYNPQLIYEKLKSVGI